MFNFDETRYIAIQSGAVAAAHALRALFGDLLAQGIDNLHFAGTGGAAILMAPAVRLLRQRSRFPVHDTLAAELMLTGHPELGGGSVVVIPSLSGTTRESVDLAGYARERGARVVALVGHEDTPLGRAADHVVINFAEDDTSCESFYVQSLAIALAIMEARDGIGDADALFSALDALPAALLDAKRDFEPDAERIARRWAGESWHIISGAGLCWPQAYYYGMCILEEMQWIRTRPVHASDFFHGTLELVGKDTSILLLKGEDDCRPLADRVERFATEYGGPLTVIDTAAFALPGLAPDLRPLVSQAVLSATLERVSAHLEHVRQHPLTTRRYYRRVPY